MQLSPVPLEMRSGLLVDLLILMVRGDNPLTETH